jgi:hypothetical protein
VPSDAIKGAEGAELADLNGSPDQVQPKSRLAGKLIVGSNMPPEVNLKKMNVALPAHPRQCLALNFSILIVISS